MTTPELMPNRTLPESADNGGRDFDRANRRSWWMVYGGVLLLLAATVFILSHTQRERQRAQLLARDAAILAAVAALESERLRDDVILGDEYLDLALAASQLEGVLGVAVLDEDGWPLIVLPEDLSSGEVDGRLLRQVHRDGARARFAEGGGFKQADPVVEVILYLDRAGPIKVPFYLVYWLEGRETARQFAALDRALFQQAGLLLVVVALLLWGAFLLGLRRQERLVRSLRHRERELAAAQADLALAAKSSALGAISAHIFHELKNPLAGLHQHLAREGGSREALASTASMQRLLQQTLGFLRAEGASFAADFSVDEVIEVLLAKVAEDFPARAVATDTEGGGRLIRGREAHVAILILGNLLRNALEASHDGVGLSFSARGRGGVFRVSDSGPGLPDIRIADPFQPRPSEKPSGTGLGLALSQQLARHIGASLQLECTGATGTTFALELAPGAFSRPDEHLQTQ